MRHMLWAAVACAAAFLIGAQAAPRAQEREAMPKRSLVDVLRPGDWVEVGWADGFFTLDVYSPEALKEAQRRLAEYEEADQKFDDLSRKQAKMTPDERKQFEKLQLSLGRPHPSPARIVEVGQDFIAYQRESPASAAAVTYLPHECARHIHRPTGAGERPQD